MHYNIVKTLLIYYKICLHIGSNKWVRHSSVILIFSSINFCSDLPCLLWSPMLCFTTTKLIILLFSFTYFNCLWSINVIVSHKCYLNVAPRKTTFPMVLHWSVDQIAILWLQSCPKRWTSSCCWEHLYRVIGNTFSFYEESQRNLQETYTCSLDLPRTPTLLKTIHIWESFCHPDPIIIANVTIC